MTVIRKSLFTIFSASALIYLVLQTAQGKQWLGDTKLWLSLLAADNKVQEEKGIVNKGTVETDLTDKSLTQNELAESKMINSDLLRTLKSDAKAVAIDLAQLRSEVTELKLNMQIVTTNRDSIKKKDIHNKDTPNLSEQYKQQENQNTDTKSRQIEQAVNQQAEAKQLQREQQARLQDVVQRMELTALQALTR